MKLWHKIVLGILLTAILLTGGGVWMIAQQFSHLLTHHAYATRMARYNQNLDVHPQTLLNKFKLENHQKQTLITEDGLELVSLFFPGKNRAAVILLHDYKTTLFKTIPIAAELVKQGYSVILPVFRAHGGSQGTEISFGRDERYDVKAAHDFLLTQSIVDAQRIGIMGNGMGGAIAIIYAVENPSIKAVAVQSPYASLSHTKQVSIRQLTGLPNILIPLVGYLIKQKLATPLETLSPLAVIDRLSPRPILIMAGGADKYVHPESGQVLFAAAKMPKQLWFEPTLGHSELQSRQPKQFQEKLLSFLNDYLLTDN